MKLKSAVRFNVTALFLYLSIVEEELHLSRPPTAPGRPGAVGVALTTHYLPQITHQHLANIYSCWTSECDWYIFN